jgi:xanthine dehydrogenase accessory factor
MNFWSQILTKLKANKKVYLLTVIQNSGSSPGRKGFKMLVAEDGFISGSIGGGVMEHKLVETTKKLLQSNDLPILLKKQIHKGQVVNSSGMICSGEQTVVFHPLNKSHINAIEQLVNGLITKSKITLKLSASGLSTFLETIANKSDCIITSETNWTYIEQIQAEEIVYIVGAGHVGLAVSKVLKLINFHVEIFDNRINLNTFNENGFVDQKHIIDYEKINEYISIEDTAYVIIMTNKYTDDKLILSQLLKNQANHKNNRFKYLGVLGSHVKIKTMFDAMESEGFSKTDLQAVFSPIGIPIKSQTPEEIAISIAAEIIRVKNVDL